jgi:hypothetical protein
VRWDVLEFLARVIDHIPEPSQKTVRYWGYYANAARGKRRKAAQTGGAAQMKILAFILDFATARAIRESLELPSQEPEPLAHAPPETLELIAESA